MRHYDRVAYEREPKAPAAPLQQVVAFLEALTDPCVLDRECLKPWIVDGTDAATYPDNNPLIAVDDQGGEL